MGSKSSHLHIKNCALVRTKSKPELRDEFWSKIYPAWFVTDDNDINQTRCPGLLKKEFHIKNGSFVGLSPKVFFNIIFHDVIFYLVLQYH